MNLPEIGVRRPTATIIFFIAITLIGLMALRYLNLDLMPKLEVPVVSVMTPYPGAGPREVEKSVTKIIETNLAVVGGLDKIESKSMENISIVSCKFDWDSDLSEAVNDIREKLSLAKRRLPEGIEEPFIFKMDLSMMPIIIYSFQSTPEIYPRLRKMIEKKIADPLKRLPGVAQAMIMGGVKREIKVELNRRNLEAAGITYDTVKNAIAASNLSFPGGRLRLNRTDYIIRVPGEFKKVDELKGVVIGQNPKTGALIKLSDIAKITDSTHEQTYFAEGRNGPSIMLMVQKQSSANTVKVARLIKKEMKKLEKTLPKGVVMIQIKDFSTSITNTIDNLKSAVFTGGIMVILVILLFLRNIRSALIMAVSIPTSLLVSFLFMYIKGYTLNMISLSSISIAIGMVVDNSIVILENIFRLRENGARPKEGAIEGAAEVGGAVMASTLTTIVIFFPVIFLGGIVGILFSQLAFMITIALLSSLLVSMLLIPSLASFTIKIKPPTGVRGWVFVQSEKIFIAIDNFYSSILKFSLRHKLAVFTTIVALSISSILLVPFVGTEYLPKMDSGFVKATIELPPGTRQEVTGKYAKELAARLNHDVPEAVALVASWGASEESALGASAMGNIQGINYATIFLSLKEKSERKRTTKQISDDVDYLKRIFPGATINVLPEDPMSSMIFGNNKPLIIEIRGHNEKIASNLARTVVEKIKGIPGVVSPEISRKEGVPEIQIKVNREKASTVGLNMGMIAIAVRNGFNGIKVSKFRVGGEEYNIFMQLRKKDRRSKADLESFKIKSLTGKLVKLGNIAKIVEKTGPVRIDRVDQERIVKVMAGISGRDLGSISSDVEKAVKTIKVPPSFELKVAGEREEQKSAFEGLLLALLLGAALVYMVMAAQFESLRDPFIILFAIPFAMVGAVWAFVVSGQTLSMMSFIGLIMLIGIVVNNGIVLVDYINILRARGYSVLNAVVAGGKSRLRPVLMTTTTTIFGMIPLARSTGEGSEMWRAMATVVIGGLIVSTVITLVFVPILYTFFEESSEKRKLRKKEKLQAKLREPSVSTS